FSAISRTLRFFTAAKKMDSGGRGVMRTIVRSGQAASGPPLGIPLPIKIHLKPDRKCLTSSSRWLASRKGPVKAGHETAGMVSVKAVYEIMQNASLNMVTKSIISSARSWNIEIVNNL
uniref:Ribosomal protein L11 C-terminal domain-containing protein n=1 Tax=Oncorhynchus mykiss TaxID=8022 RepID=A0A8C7LRY9_ONCMY